MLVSNIVTIKSQINKINIIKVKMAERSMRLHKKKN